MTLFEVCFVLVPELVVCLLAQWGDAQKGVLYTMMGYHSGYSLGNQNVFSVMMS